MILSVKEVSKKFSGEKEPAVDSVSLNVKKGEILALLGESGSGKTTLLRMIAGFEIPSSGSVIINGQTVAGNDVFIPPEKRGIGLVFQDHSLFPHLTVEENMIFGISRLPEQEKKMRVNRLLELAGVGNLHKRYPHELSGGQKQRIALARALAPEPSVILFDEPFSSIDSLLKTQLREEIRSILKKAGSTAIFVTHDTKDAMSMADRISVLRRGKLLQTGSAGELYNHPVNAYVAAFFGKTNLIEASVGDQELHTAIGVFPYKGGKRDKGKKVTLSIRPEDFVLKKNPEGCICGNIVDRNFMGEYSELKCEVTTTGGETEEVTIRIAPGEPCEEKTCYFKARKSSIHILGHKPGHEAG